MSLRVSHGEVAVDEAVRGMGLGWYELRYLLEGEIERMHAWLGQAVRAYVDIDDLHCHVTVYDVGGFAERRLRFHLQPTPEEFRAVVDGYARDRNASLGWVVALGTCIGLNADHSLLELSDHNELGGQLAVLPHALLGGTDRATWRRGAARYVGLFKASDRPLEGAAAWHNAGARWIATRRHSIFLRSLLLRFLGIAAHTEIIGDFGMVVLAKHAELGAFVGTAGENAKALRDLAGLRELSVVRDVSDREPRHRLTSAVRQLSQAQRFTLIEPAAGAHEWVIQAPGAAAKRIAGVGGLRLTMIARLSGLRVKLIERNA